MTTINSLQQRASDLGVTITAVAYHKDARGACGGYVLDGTGWSADTFSASLDEVSDKLKALGWMRHLYPAAK